MSRKRNMLNIYFCLPWHTFRPRVPLHVSTVWSSAPLPDLLVTLVMTYRTVWPQYWNITVPRHCLTKTFHVTQKKIKLFLNFFNPRMSWVVHDCPLNVVIQKLRLNSAFKLIYRLILTCCVSNNHKTKDYVVTLYQPHTFPTC